MKSIIRPFGLHTMKSIIRPLGLHTMKSIIRPLGLRTLALLAGLALLASPSAQAQINYQGRLTDSVGAPLPDGQYNLEFSLWDDPTAGTLIWGPYLADGAGGAGHGAKADLVDSRFNVVIGASDTANGSLTTAMSSAGGRYLQIKVNANAPISPRQIILAAPRALVADVIPNVVPNASGVTLSGNVGIGTASPAARLHVAGSGWFGTDSGGLPSSAGVGVRLFYDTVTEAGQIYSYNYGTFQAASLALQGPGGNVGIGTTAPAAKLDVHGDVKLGPSGEYYAPAAEENLRILRGWATANTPKGVVNGPFNGVGSGFTYVAVSQGVVDVTFNTPFAGAPCVTANPISTGGIIIQMEAQGGGGVPTPSGFRANILDLSGNGRDWPFNFIAIGPR